MATTTVGTVLSRVKTILQEAGPGIRWTDVELLDWLNEGYPAVIAIKPDAGSVSAEMACVAGTRQSIPSDGVRLLGVLRNTADGSGGDAVMPTTREVLDLARRGWHAEPASLAIEQAAYDPLDPQRFYVYPPAKLGAKLEILYAAVPEPHAVEQATSSSDEPIRFLDTYAPALVDYVLFRAFSKDAEGQANLARAQMHSTSFVNGLGGSPAETPA